MAITYVTKNCPHCSTPFEIPKGERQKFCSRTCGRLGQPKRPISDRVMGLVNFDCPHGCWLWKGFKGPTGYGVFTVSDGVGKRAHRLSWEIHRGPIPDGLDVLHDCDKFYPVGDVTYRACVNPEHLWLGTHMDNMRDRDSKGRNNAPMGEATGQAKLKEAQVLEILRLPKVGHLSIAKRFGVSPSLISNIQRGKSWKHLHRQD